MLLAGWGAWHTVHAAPSTNTPPQPKSCGVLHAACAQIHWESSCALGAAAQPFRTHNAPPLALHSELVQCLASAPPPSILNTPPRARRALLLPTALLL